MVKRTPPLAVAVIGTGEASKKSVEALLSDFTAPYADVTFILPVTNEHWTDTTGVVADWLAENDVPYVAVTTGDGVDKTLTDYLEGADEVMKVARVSTKLVQLLQQEKSDGDVALLVAWDDDDAEAVTAVNKALTAEVKAYNLLDGLDEFTFDDDEDEETQAHGLPDDAGDQQPGVDEEDAPAAAKIGDEYDDWGIRKLRAALRERSDEHDIPDKTIGQLEKDDAIRALRNLDNGRGKAATKEAEAAAERQEGETDEEPVAHSRQIADKIKGEQTKRARRAFAEGVAEATGQDEAQVDLPNSRGGDLLAEQGSDEEPMAVQADRAQAEDEAAADTAEDAPWRDTTLRIQALELAIRGGKTGTEALADAMKYETYLKGERRSAGRPRADGTPAQPREINPETGKPVTRRRPRSTE